MVLSNYTGFPDPFAVLTVDGEQTKTTSVIKKTLNPYWNESFDVYGLTSAFANH
jgi:E3 ubiquitin-protein ligase NEDD4